jgi:hypothetical protein
MQATDAARGARAGSAGRRGIAGLLLVMVGLGCTSVRQLPVDALPPEGSGKARVVLRDGYDGYVFERVLVRGDSVIGVYQVVEERITPGGEIAFVDVDQQTVLRREAVAHVELRRLDWSKTFLVGAGGILAGFFLATLVDPGEADEESGGKINPL